MAILVCENDRLILQVGQLDMPPLPIVQVVRSMWWTVHLSFVKRKQTMERRRIFSSELCVSLTMKPPPFSTPSRHMVSRA